ncbi:MAG: hypothetical protein J5537_03775 [Lachnospiraceae bacterium]|nr:hypothetical protein [Lachnospiraceae bacterium]
MMNKKLVNKKVIKALTIGLSLAMAGQPLTAMAAEPETSSPDPATDTMPTYKDVENGVADDAQEQADATWVDIKTAEASAVVAVEEASGDGISEEVKEAAEALGDGMEAHIEGNTVIDAPETDIEKAAGVLGVAEGFAEIVDSKVTEANQKADITEQKAEAAATLQTQAETIANDITTTVNEAQTFVDEKAKELEDAGSEKEVNEVYEVIETKVNDTNDAVEKAASDLTKIEENFNKANEDLEEATREYNELVNGINGIGNSATAFGDNMAAAAREAAEAKARVDELKEQAEALKNAAEAAKEKYEGLQKVKELEDAIVANLLDGNNSNNPVTGSTTFIDYFKAVVQYYYIPEIGGKVISIERKAAENPSSNLWNDNSTSKSTSGDTLNYYIVKYEKDGVEETVYLNYKLQNNNKVDSRWHGIVIFEKTAHSVVDGHDIENLKDDGTGTLTYTDKNNNVSKYVLEDGKYYKLVGYDKKELTVETQLRNDNWYSGNVLLVTKQDTKADFKPGIDMEYKTDGREKYSDKNMKFSDAQRQPMLNFRNALASSAELALKYASIAEKATAAQAAFEKAQSDVAELQRRIGEVSLGDTSVDEVATMQASLETAKSKLEAAKEVRDNMVKQLETIKTVRDNKIAALTYKAPATDGGSADTTATTDDVAVTAGVITNVITPEAPAAPAAGGAATIVVTGGATDNAAGDEVVVTEGASEENLTNINDGRTALASVLDEETAPEVTAINEGDTPLTYAPIDEESISWWWWIIIALLGATGYAMYKKHQEKKAEKVTK